VPSRSSARPRSVSPPWPQDHADNEGIKGKITESAKKFFKPEFLNRLDDIVIFKMLEKEQLNTIVDLEVNKVLVRLKNKKIHIVSTTAAREFLMKEGYDPQYGARPMRRAVEKHIEDPVIGLWRDGEQRRLPRWPWRWLQLGAGLL
jgi:ATP-dependent Clp protease ATP-binding subunit ClpC